MGKEYVISEELVQGLLEYLLNQKCGDTRHGVYALENLEEIIKEEEE